MFLLVTAGGVFLGMAYAGFVDRRLGPRDWRRWMALAPFWALAVGVSLALHAVNMKDLAPQMIQAFAIGSFGETLIDSLRVRRRGRANEGTGRDDRIATFPDESA